MIYTHKLAKGTVEVSALKNYGIELAKMSSMPKEVIARAEEIAQELMEAKKVRVHAWKLDT